MITLPLATSVYRGLARKSWPPRDAAGGCHFSLEIAAGHVFQLDKIAHLSAVAVTDYKAKAQATGRTFAARIDPLNSRPPQVLRCSGGRSMADPGGGDDSGPLALGGAAVLVIPALGSVRMSPVEPLRYD